MQFIGRKVKVRFLPGNTDTLNTLLYRLDQKHIVQRTHAYVESIASKKLLLQLQTQDMLDDLYGGEYLNFIAALTKTPA